MKRRHGSCGWLAARGAGACQLGSRRPFPGPIGVVRRLRSGVQRTVPKSLDQTSCAVSQHQGRIRLDFEKQTPDRSDPAVHRVRCCHRWQREVEAPRPFSLHQSLGQHQCRLGLARAGHILEQEELRPLLQRHLGCPLLKRGRCVDAFEQLQRIGPETDLLWRQPLRPPRAGPFPIPGRTRLAALADPSEDRLQTLINDTPGALWHRRHP